MSSVFFWVVETSKTQRVHVGIWYTLKAQRGSHIPTLRPKYLPDSYMDPLGDYIPYIKYYTPKGG